VRVQGKRDVDEHERDLAEVCSGAKRTLPALWLNPLFRPCRAGYFSWNAPRKCNQKKRTPSLRTQGEVNQKIKAKLLLIWLLTYRPLDCAEHRSARRGRWTGMSTAHRHGRMPRRCGSAEHARSARHPAQRGAITRHVFFGYYSLTCVKESNPPSKGGIKLSADSLDKSRLAPAEVPKRLIRAQSHFVRRAHAAIRNSPH